MAHIVQGGSVKVNSFELWLNLGVSLGSQGTPFELFTEWERGVV